MGSADYTSIVVTSTFLGICFIHVAKEFSFSLKIKDSTSSEDGFNSPPAVKQRLGKNINKLFVTHVGSNDLALIFILLATAAIIWAVSGKLANALCFILGAITSVGVGLIVIFVSRRTASKLVNLAHGGIRRVYKRCIGNASALVVLCLGLNALVILAMSSALTLNVTNNANITTALKAISFYSFGTLVVTLYSRTSGGLYNNAFSILAQSHLENEDENRPIFDSMNTYLMNIYEVILEVVAIVSTLFCTYFLVIGGFSDAGNMVANSFAYINFPVLVFAFSMAVSVVFIFIFGFIMKNNSMRLIKRTFLYITGSSLVVIIILLPIFHATFTPKHLDTFKYARFTNYGLVFSGCVSGLVVAISNFYFLSSYTKPGKSVNLSVFTSLTGGMVNSVSFAKLLCVVPTLAVCFNLMMCVFGSDIYGLLYVAIGFMCLLTMVLVGSVFYSLMVTSSKFAKYCNYDNDVRHMLGSFKRSWYDINALVRPFISTMSILIALVLLSHLSHSLNLNKYSHFNPLVVMSTLIGCLFPVFQSGLILRISSGIANWRLKRKGYLSLLNELYLDHGDEDREDNDDPDLKNSLERNKKILNMLKFWKKSGFGKKSKGKRSMSGQSKSSKQGPKKQASENGDTPEGDTEEVVVNVHGESNNNYRTFGRAFKACLLKEAGVREDMLLNAPIMCSSARSTHQDYLTPNLAAQANLNQQNDLDVHNAAAEVVEDTEAAIPQDTENIDGKGSRSVYKHGSRDYRILKNADNHYKMFHPKYHDKHFNLRKKSKVASGNLEELQSLLSKDSEPVDETNETSIYCPSYELSDGVNSEIDCEPGDSLDKVYRRSEDMQKDVVRSLNIQYYNQNSCGSGYTERECGPIFKVLQDNQVHTREPESDTESNTKNRGNGSSQPSESSHSKRGSNEGRRRFGRPLRRSRGRKQPAEPRSDETSANIEEAEAIPDESSVNIEPAPTQSDEASVTIEQAPTQSDEASVTIEQAPTQSDDQSVTIVETEEKPDEASGNEEPATAPSSSPVDSTEIQPPEEMDILARLSSFRSNSDIPSQNNTPMSKRKFSIPKFFQVTKTHAPSSDKESPAARLGRDTPIAPTGKNTPVSASGNESPRSQSSKLTDSGLGATDSSAPEPMGPSSSAPENGARPADSGHSDNDKGIAQELNIKIQQNLIPPDVDISNQPRRPTPKCIELPVFKDLEAGSSEKVASSDSSKITSYSKTSSYHNTLMSMLFSVVPFIFSLGFPMLFGVVFGSIPVSVMALFSTVASSLLVQVMIFCSNSWESTLLFMESKRARDENNGHDQVVNDTDFKNGMAITMIGKITLCSVGPVLNTLVIAIPLLCVLAADQFKKFSNINGFPSWSKIEA